MSSGNAKIRAPSFLAIVIAYLAFKNCSWWIANIWRRGKNLIMSATFKSVFEFPVQDYTF